MYQLVSRMCGQVHTWVCACMHVCKKKPKWQENHNSARSPEFGLNFHTKNSEDFQGKQLGKRVENLIIWEMELMMLTWTRKKTGVDIEF